MLLMLAATACASLSQAAGPKGPLTVTLLYPTKGSRIEMGQALKAIIDVKDANGLPASEAGVQLNLIDSAGTTVATVPAHFGSGDVYRSEPWTIPHRSQPGAWTVTVSATTPEAEGSASTEFQVKESPSETLLRKYGFWVDVPRLNSIESSLMGEQGDAENGLIILGGVRPMQHIYLENWLEVQWRKGDFHITTPEGARDFMLVQIGSFGIYPVRQLGTFQPVKFKQWDAWQATARGQLAQYELEWMIFYAPEVDKTYVLGTLVVLPPPGIDAHEVLRQGFEVHPEVNAAAVAPNKLPRLEQAPLQIAPDLGTRFTGTDASIILKWEPIRPLAEDEYYQVQVDYNYSESNTVVKYTTRETELQLPAPLYDQPNCGVFNWQVSVMRQTGIDANGQPRGEPVSYNSLYWYVEWLRPQGERPPFTPKCQNPQT